MVLIVRALKALIIRLQPACKQPRPSEYIPCTLCRLKVASLDSHEKAALPGSWCVWHTRWMFSLLVDLHEHEPINAEQV